MDQEGAPTKRITREKKALRRELWYFDVEEGAKSDDARAYMVEHEGVSCLEKSHYFFSCRSQVEDKLTGLRGRRKCSVFPLEIGCRIINRTEEHRRFLLQRPE